MNIAAIACAKPICWLNGVSDRFLGDLQSECRIRPFCKRHRFIVRRPTSLSSTHGSGIYWPGGVPIRCSRNVAR